MVQPRVRLPQKHGTPAAYRMGCSCDDCRQAWRRYISGYRAARKDREAPDGAK